MSVAELEKLRNRIDDAMYMRKRMERLRRLNREIEENSADDDASVDPAYIISDEAISRVTRGKD